MAHIEAFGDQPVFRVDDVAIAVVREFSAQPVARLARSAAADPVRQDNEVFGGIERLARAEQFVAERRPQPVGADAARAVEQEHPVDDAAGSIAFLGAKRAVVKLELGQRLTIGEAEIFEHEIALAQIRPGGRCGLGKRGRRGDQKGSGRQRADQHQWSPRMHGIARQPNTRERGQRAACGSTIARTMSIARRISVIEASNVRKPACEESVTFSMRASG